MKLKSSPTGVSLILLPLKSVIKDEHTPQPKVT